MMLDNSLVFSNAQAITVTADSTNVVDITGAGSGNAPAMIGNQGTNTAMGFDIGASDGDERPHLFVTVTAAGTTSNTLTISLNAAPDNGSYSPGTYTALWTSKAFTGSTLQVGNYLVVPVPSTLFQFTSSKEALPRFYKLIYTCSGSLTVSVTSTLLINPTSALLGGQYGSNLLAA